MTVFGVHTGLQNTTIAELRDLWTRIEDHGFDWISIWDHFYSADFSRLPVPRGRRVPRRPRLPHLTRAGGVARLLRRLPAPGRARQRHRHDRPPLRRASRPRARRRLGVQRVRRLRHPLPVGRRAPRPPRGVDPGHPGAAAAGRHRLLRDPRPAHRGPVRAEARAGRAADLGRRRRGAADAAHRGEVRRRVERALRLARDHRPQAGGARRPLQHGRPRPRRRSARRSTSVSAGTTTPSSRSSASSPSGCGRG